MDTRDHSIATLSDIDKALAGVNDRINCANRAIDAVNARLDDEVHYRFEALTSHTQNHERRISELENPKPNPLPGFYLRKNSEGEWYQTSCTRKQERRRYGD